MATAELRSAHEKKISRVLRERMILLQEADRDPSIRPLIIERSKRDVKWFCNTWITTYNPRVKPSLIPFVLFEEQEKMLDWLEECYREGKWGAEVKCRYTGASYIVTMYMLHKLLYERDFSGMLASNKAESVDKTNSSKSLFYKIIDMYKRLPAWMQTFDMATAKTKMLISNTAMNSSILGESGAQIGRGGRSSMALVDEAAHIEADDAMVASLSENTDCAIFVSTPKGVANQFFRLVHSGELSVFYYRWESDPRRDPDWRVKQDLKLGQAIAAQELDCDFYADTGANLIEAKWIQLAIDSHLKIEGMDKISNLTSFNNDADCQAGLDLAGSGANKSVLTVRVGSVVTDIIEIDFQTVTEVTLEAHRIMMQDLKYTPHTLCFDSDGLGADVRGVINNFEFYPDYEMIAFRGGKAPSPRYWDQLDQKSTDFLFNRRAEAWWIMRTRIKNTHDHLSGLASHNIDDMISLPNDQRLIQDLLKPAFHYRSSKILVESKQDMIKRGISSPDFADSLAYCLYETGRCPWN